MAYLVGLDLGQSMDYSALVVVEQVLASPAQPVYAVRHLQRWALGTPYPTIIQQTQALFSRPPLQGRRELIVDHTGCGRPVVDAIRQQGLGCIAVSLHEGDSVSHFGSNWCVPKRDLVGAVQLLLQQQRLRVAEALPLTPVLTQELLTFRVTIDPATAHDSYSSWHERDHDDLVLALALAVWWGAREELSRPPQVDLSKALTGMTKRGIARFPGSGRRQWKDDVHDQDNFDMDAWEEAKRNCGR